MADYSCYVWIELSRSMPQDLRLWRQQAVAGDWTWEPYNLLRTGSRPFFCRLKDNAVSYGTEGELVYGANGNVTLKFACPYVRDNRVSATTDMGPEFALDLWTKVANGSWRKDSVEPRNHPLWVYLGIRRVTAPPFPVPNVNLQNPSGV